MEYLPAGLLALFACWSGSLPGGATWSGAASGQVALLAVALLGAREVADPLRLGRWGRFLPLAFYVALLLSWLTSPVPRAGRVAVLLLPAFLLVAAGVARCWADARRRRRGIVAVAVVVSVVSGWGMVDRMVRSRAAAVLSASTPAVATSAVPTAVRAAMPLGHHNLLALWLVTALPLAALAWRERGAPRVLAGVAVALAVSALVASGSLGGAAALVCEVFVLAALWRRGRMALLVAGVTAVFALGILQTPRLARVLAGRDPSLRARAVYWHAGVATAAARPWLGWGPGAVAWIAPERLAPVPAVNPPGEVLGDFHSLPLDLAAQVGGVGVGLALATAIAFVVRRRRDAASAPDRALLGASAISLAGFGVGSLAGAPLAIVALPVATAIACGAGLAGSPAAAGPSPGGVPAPRWLPPAAVATYALMVALTLVPFDLAEWHYQRAVSAASPADARREIERARDLDPGFPLYRSRAAWLATREPGATSAALESARAARGAAPLWLAAGAIAARAGDAGADEALARAVALDPLGALAAFQRLILDPAGPRAIACGAHAVLAEPRLLAAPWWRRHEDLRQLVVERIGRSVGVDPGWREALLAQAAGLGAAPTAGSARAELALVMDEDPSLSFSLYLFRRSPWPARLAGVEVERAAAEAITVPSAATLPTTAPDVFRDECASR